MKLLSIAIVVVALTGCTSVTVRPIDKNIVLKHVCIQENSRVEVSDFVTVIRDGFSRHNISTEVVSNTHQSNCDVLLTYTALRSWDVTPYLSHAELRLERGGRQIAYAEYHLNGKGGLSLTKWAGTRSKMDPVLDELLADYK